MCQKPLQLNMVNVGWLFIDAARHEAHLWRMKRKRLSSECLIITSEWVPQHSMTGTLNAEQWFCLSELHKLDGDSYDSHSALGVTREQEATNSRK